MTSNSEYFSFNVAIRATNEDKVEKEFYFVRATTLEEAEKKLYAHLVNCWRNPYENYVFTISTSKNYNPKGKYC